MVEKAKPAEGRIVINSESFIHENPGNIKDFYKISSCIGRGKLFVNLTLLLVNSPCQLSD
jgi:hypothetical protein